MNRLLPHRPPHVRIRRHVGSLPHGLPTALVFAGSVVALMLGSFLVVDSAIPTLIRPDRDDAYTGPLASDAASPSDGVGTATPEATTASSAPDATRPPIVLIRAGAQPAGGRRATQASSWSGGSGGNPSQGDRRSPSPTAGSHGGGWDRGTPGPSPSQSPSEDEDEGRRSSPTPPARQAPTPTPNPTPTQRPSPTPRPTPRPSLPPPSAQPTPTPMPTASPTPVRHD